MSADTRGEFIDKVVKDQCQIKGINPDNVLGVRLRANGRTIQPEIWTKTSTEPIRVNPFNDADVARFRREHIAFSTAAICDTNTRFRCSGSSQVAIMCSTTRPMAEVSA